MRLGIHLPQYRDPVPGEVLAAAARDAESAGADDVWVSDHLILPPGSRHPPTAFHDALTVLSWAAAATGRVGLGTSVLVVPYRHPVALAKSLASLDALSGGRVIAGLASGWMESEFRALGVPFAQRGRRTDAAIGVMRALWSGANGYDWLDERVDDVELAPPPARPGGPPIWIGGNSDAGLARAARAGDAWHTTIRDPGALAERIAALERALEREGRSRADLTVSVRAYADRAAMADLAPRLAELGVDHVLVAPPRFVPEAFGEEVAALRELIRGG
jgi:probable F420-dependent oxidoreductase